MKSKICLFENEVVNEVFGDLEERSNSLSPQPALGVLDKGHDLCYCPYHLNIGHTIRDYPTLKE